MMDYIFISRKDYISYKTQGLSPESAESWSFHWDQDFSDMQRLVAKRRDALPLYKRVALAAAFALMLLGVTAIVYLALKCLFV